MKKMIIVAIAVLAMSGLVLAQATTPWTPGAWSTTVPGGVTAPAKGFSIDKLGGHQNGGRGCVGCHAPHSGGRGNGGVMHWDAGTSTYVNTPVVGVSGDEVLWGEDLGPIYGQKFSFPDNPDDGSTGDLTITAASPERQITGVAMCLSCHDGNVAKGAMMANQSFEQVAGMLPSNYGGSPIPTLLGADGGSFGNYKNDHPVGPNATLGTVGHGAINKAKGFFDVATVSGVVVVGKGASFTGSTMEEFYKNYGLPLIVDARGGAGFATDVDPTNVDKAYVVCTTCHTPHSMYTTTATLNGVKKGTVPTFFFIAAPYNPGANTANGTKASSATQFCRQCHFSGPGGANEASGISIPTAF
jgi:hypothetical protein